MRSHAEVPPLPGQGYVKLASLRARVTNVAAVTSLPMGRLQRHVGVAVTAEILAAPAATARRPKAHPTFCPPRLRRNAW